MYICGLIPLNFAELAGAVPIVSTYDFSTLYTTLPYNLIKEKLTELIKQTFNRDGSHYFVCDVKL